MPEVHMLRAKRIMQEYQTTTLKQSCLGFVEYASDVHLMTKGWSTTRLGRIGSDPAAIDQGNQNRIRVLLEGPKVAMRHLTLWCRVGLALYGIFDSVPS